MNKSAVHQIVTVLSSEVLQGTFNVGPHAIRFARTEGYFPGSWFGTLEPMCIAAEIECPRDAFKWKGAVEDIPDASDIAKAS